MLPYKIEQHEFYEEIYHKEEDRELTISLEVTLSDGKGTQVRIRGHGGFRYEDITLAPIALKSLLHIIDNLPTETKEELALACESY